MAQEKSSAYSIFINVTLPDGTKTAFSFAEFLLWAGYSGMTIDEEDQEGWITWLQADDNELGRMSYFSHIQLIRKLRSDDPAVQEFKRHAIENEIPY